HFVEALRARPAHEAPFEAMRNAMLAAWDTIEEAVGEVVPVELHMRTYQVIESTPALLAVRIRRSLETEEKIARILAAREGLDLDTDPRPRIAVAAFGSAMQVADRIWNARGDHSREAIRAIAADCLDQLRPAVAESWRT
ncbi:acyl-CoA-like ligand-binding transcription factor, partial [Streptomyces clavuligerus]